MHGIRVGWQARYVGEPRYRDMPKYYTCPGMPKSQLLYNFDSTMTKPFVVLVEGITDVWRIGTMPWRCWARRFPRGRRNS